MGTHASIGFKNVTVPSILLPLQQRSAFSDGEALRLLNIGSENDYLSADHKAVEVYGQGKTKPCVCYRLLLDSAL